MRSENPIRSMWFHSAAASSFNGQSKLKSSIVNNTYTHCQFSFSDKSTSSENPITCSVLTRASFPSSLDYCSELVAVTHCEHVTWSAAWATDHQNPCDSGACGTYDHSNYHLFLSLCHTESLPKATQQNDRSCSQSSDTILRQKSPRTNKDTILQRRSTDGPAQPFCGSHPSVSVCCERHAGASCDELLGSACLRSPVCEFSVLWTSLRKVLPWDKTVGGDEARPGVFAFLWNRERAGSGPFQQDREAFCTAVLQVRGKLTFSLLLLSSSSLLLFLFLCVRSFVCFTKNKGNSSTKSWESQHSVFGLLTKIFKTHFLIFGFIKIIPLVHF